MALILHTVALVIAGLFAGGAMMQTVVDHPARRAAGGFCAIEQMQQSLGRADPYMPILATIGAVTGLGAYFMGARIVDLFAALLFVAIGIHTFTFIIPINKRIKAFRPSDPDVSPILALMRRWGFLHAARSVAGTLALVLLATANFLPLR